MAETPDPSDLIDIGTMALMHVVNRIPGFKVLKIVYDETVLSIEVEAGGKIVPEAFGESGLQALIKRGLTKGGVLLIHQYIPGSQEISIDAVDGRTRPISWIAVYGVGLQPGGTSIPMTADEVEQLFPVADYDGRVLYKDFIEIIPRRKGA